MSTQTTIGSHNHQANIAFSTHLPEVCRVRQFDKARLATALPVILMIAACTAPPPQHMTLNWAAATNRYGYVSRVEYFTETQMHDPRWEFSRIKTATGSLCPGYLSFVRRDVRWFEATEISRQRCARVVYTMRCVAVENTQDIGTPMPEGALDKERIALLNEPPASVIEPHCGEKDQDKRRPNKIRKTAR